MPIKVFKLCCIAFTALGLRVPRFAIKCKSASGNYGRSGFSIDGLKEFLETVYYISTVVISILSMFIYLGVACSTISNENAMVASTGVMMSVVAALVLLLQIHSHLHQSAIQDLIRSMSALVKLMDRSDQKIFPKGTFVILPAVFVCLSCNMYGLLASVNIRKHVLPHISIQTSVVTFYIFYTICSFFLILFHALIVLAGHSFETISVKATAFFITTGVALDEVYSTIEDRASFASVLVLLDRCQELIMSFFSFHLLIINLFLLLSFCCTVYLSIDNFFSNFDSYSQLYFSSSVAWNILHLLLLHYSADIFRNKVRRKQDTNQ